jgi:hypothetical protein
MTQDAALEVALNVMHQVRQGTRSYLPYTEVVDVIKALEEVRKDLESLRA